MTSGILTIPQKLQWPWNRLDMPKTVQQKILKLGRLTDDEYLRVSDILEIMQLVYQIPFFYNTVYEIQRDRVPRRQSGQAHRRYISMAKQQETVRLAKLTGENYMTGKEIAEKLERDPTTINHIIREADIQRNRPFHPYSVDSEKQKAIEELQARVENRDVTIAEISRRFAIGEEAVARVLRKAGMTKRLKRKDSPWKKTLSSAEQQQLRKWFIELNWGSTLNGKMDKRIGLPPGNLRWLLKKYGIYQEKWSQKKSHHWCSGFRRAGHWELKAEFGMHHICGKHYYNHLCKPCYRANKNERERRLRKTSLKYRLNRLMKEGITKSLKDRKGGRSWQVLVNYTVSDLKKRLQRTMPRGYSWQDYLHARLHIDHIIPLAAFAFTKPEDLAFHEAWTLGNLRLLPAKDNIKKGDKLPHSFQQLLPIEINPKKQGTHVPAPTPPHHSDCPQKGVLSR